MRVCKKDGRSGGSDVLPEFQKRTARFFKKKIMKISHYAHTNDINKTVSLKMDKWV